MSSDHFEGKREVTEDAEFITLPNNLKRKVGEGGIPTRLLDECQTFINDSKIEFRPYAEKYLKGIENALKQAKKTDSKEKKKQAIDFMSNHIMQLKANGGMFGYDLISMISDVALNFIETSAHANEDLYKIIEAHNNSLSLIIKNELKGTGGDIGPQLVSELQQAISRYQKKYVAP